MTPQQLFEIGSKLIGLYFLVLSAPILLSVIVGGLFSNAWGQIGDAPMKIYLAISISGQIVFMVLGLTLIKGQVLFCELFLEQKESFRK